jgi:serine protease AprX
MEGVNHMTRSTRRVAWLGVSVILAGTVLMGASPALAGGGGGGGGTGGTGGTGGSGGGGGGTDGRNGTDGRRQTINSWTYDSGSTPFSLESVATSIGAATLSKLGYTGKGVGIALIDTGVAKVPGLSTGNVVYGPDLSFESQDPATRYIDTYGHGTHLAGIMVGNDARVNFKGIAPGAKLTSVKVGAANGAVDVVQVLAAVDWVVKHRNDDPRNPIKILNLAYGTDSVQDYKTGPLAFAVEQAWKAGITVVIAGGNTGTTTPRLADPAYDPYVLAVGATDDKGTASPADDTLADYSSRGDSARRVDVVVPGRSIPSLRAPGSYIDVTYPAARVDTVLFKGSGTSQASAVVSGALALLLQARPTLTPDQLKALARAAVTKIKTIDGTAGTGELLISSGLLASAPSAKQTFPPSTGTGPVEAARGNDHVTLDGVQLTGEKDIFGAAFSAPAWATASGAGTSWSGGKWMGIDWTGDAWTTAGGVPAWSGRAWSGRAWSGRAWSGSSWSGASWSGSSWGS